MTVAASLAAPRRADAGGYSPDRAAVRQLVPASADLFQVSASIGPLNQWPSGHRILALSSGPPVDRIVYRWVTSAGSPHLDAPWA
jgi:hypothetical protein